MRKPLMTVTDEDVRGATCVVLCNTGHSKSLAVAGENAAPDRLALGASEIKPRTLFIVVRSEAEFDEAMRRLRPIRHDIRPLDEMSRKHFAAGH